MHPFIGYSLYPKLMFCILLGRNTWTVKMDTVRKIFMQSQYKFAWRLYSLKFKQRLRSSFVHHWLWRQTNMMHLVLFHREQQTNLSTQFTKMASVVSHVLAHVFAMWSFHLCVCRLVSVCILYKCVVYMLTPVCADHKCMWRSEDKLVCVPLSFTLLETGSLLLFCCELQASLHRSF